MEVRIRKNGEKEALWKTRMQACAQSCLSKKAFCFSEYVALSTYRYWKARMFYRSKTKKFAPREKYSQTLFFPEEYFFDVPVIKPRKNLSVLHVSMDVH